MTQLSWLACQGLFIGETKDTASVATPRAKHAVYFRNIHNHNYHCSMGILEWRQLLGSKFSLTTV